MAKRILSDVEKRTSKGTTQQQKNLNKVVTKRRMEQLWIVFAGKTGVGKSTLINYIFAPKQPLVEGIGKSGTKKATSSTDILDLDNGNRGSLKYTDLPGIGEKKETQSKVESLNKKYFEKCDLIVWLFKSDDNAKAEEQPFLKSLPNSIKRKMVFGLSKIDQPVNRGKWDSQNNEPDENLSEHILRRIASLKETFDLPDEQIIPFSIYQNYDIDILKNCMIQSIQGKGDILAEKFAFISNNPKK